MSNRVGVAEGSSLFPGEPMLCRIRFGLFLLDVKNLFEIDDQLAEEISTALLVFIPTLSLQ